MSNRAAYALAVAVLILALAVYAGAHEIAREVYWIGRGN